MQRLRVFYDDHQSVDDNRSFSPSAGKPAAVWHDWQDAGLAVERGDVSPVTLDQLKLAHDPTYVDDVLNCKVSNGFGNRLQSVADSLPWTSGSFLAAAQNSIRTGEASASLTSGFHHAGYDAGGGFCTFNGLMVTALVLRSSGLSQRVGILDLDMHYGDGTQHIMDHLGLDWIVHYTLGRYALSPELAREWLNSIPREIEAMRECDVVLFQAGADPHIDDPLGGFLTTAQLMERDHMSFAACKKLGVPVAWNLAGGYQTPLEKVLEIHRNTAVACLDVYAH